MASFEAVRVLVRGGGDLGSGVIYRLHRAGFPVVVTELAAPKLVRRAVSYGDAVTSGRITVHGITARQTSADDIDMALGSGVVPVVVDADGAIIARVQPLVVVDARMEKRNPGTRMDDAALVIALGPGYTAGVDCHAVIETKRGHDLGRVITEGRAEPNSGEPGRVQGQSHTRVLRAPAAGQVTAHATIGDVIHAGQPIASVGGEVIVAPFDGVLRGLVHEAVPVTVGMKIGDLDPRSRREHCFTISDKALAVGGGVLEAVLAADVVRAALC